MVTSSLFLTGALRFTLSARLATTTVFSRTTSLADLSSRTPWNDACLTRSPWVQPWKSTSTTVLGSTQIGLRTPLSSAGMSLMGGVGIFYGLGLRKKRRWSYGGEAGPAATV